MLWIALGIAVMGISLLLIPFGVPGTWIMVVVLAIGASFHQVGVLTLAVATALALAAEIAEFAFVKRYSARYGGGRRAFWGALVGGMVGVFVGLPVPLIGSIVAGFVGSFLGAAVADYTRSRDIAASSRVGWGVFLGRVVSAGVKAAAGVVILALGIWALLN